MNVLFSLFDFHAFIWTKGLLHADVGCTAWGDAELAGNTVLAGFTLVHRRWRVVHREKVVGRMLMNLERGFRARFDSHSMRC